MIKKFVNNYIRELYINKKTFFIFLIFLFFYFLLFSNFDSFLEANRDIMYFYILYSSIYFKNMIEVIYSCDTKKVNHLLYGGEYARLTTYLFYFTVIIILIFSISSIFNVDLNIYNLLYLFSMLMYLPSFFFKRATLFFAVLVFLLIFSYFQSFLINLHFFVIWIIFTLASYLYLFIIKKMN
jgi:hypothetical protein